MVCLFDLANELLLQVLGFLPGKDQLSLVSTCHRYRQFLPDTALWLVVTPENAHLLNQMKWYPPNISVDKFKYHVIDSSIGLTVLDLSFIECIRKIYIRDKSYLSEIQCHSECDLEKILVEETEGSLVRRLSKGTLDKKITIKPTRVMKLPLIPDEIKLSDIRKMLDLICVPASNLLIQKSDLESGQTSNRFSSSKRFAAIRELSRRSQSKSNIDHPDFLHGGFGN
jgi:hypothetical protein